MNHISTIVPINSNEISNTKKIILNPTDINNKRSRKKNLILEYSYNNRKYNYQANNINYNNSITENLYSNIDTPKKNNNQKIITHNNSCQTPNIIFNSARHIKSKSLINSDMDLFKNKIDYQNLNINRNNSNKNNLSFKNYQSVPI